MRKVLLRSLSTLRAIAGRNSGDRLAGDQFCSHAWHTSSPVQQAGSLERSFQSAKWDEFKLSLGGSCPRDGGAVSCCTGPKQGMKSYATSPPSGDEDGEEDRTAGDASVFLPEAEFHKLADEVLHRLQEKLEEQADSLEIDGFDSDYADGVLTVRLGKLGTYVLNKQTPNRQIWFSSPVSGPARFDWIPANESWIYRRTEAELWSFLEKELTNLLGAPVALI